MKPNIGRIDKAARIILGLVLLSLIAWGPQTWWGLLGLILLGTAFIGYCPLYSLLKISTTQKQ
ncbi:MAG TPA: DUF2892 domain-containing protein [Bacteroidota bacterium]|nr:DUF2892 domain-containing protein [Bacteroidota bacterium]